LTTATSESIRRIHDLAGRGVLLKHATAVAVVVLGVMLAAAPTPTRAAPSPARTGEVERWVEVGLAEIAAHRTSPPRASRLLAHLSVALYAATTGGGDDRATAIAAAAAEVLSYFYPDRAAYFDSRATGGGAAGFARGRAIGALLVERARRDGSDAVWDGTLPAGPGLWVPTPPAFVYPPLEPLAGTWRTWNLDSGWHFRPGPPPDFGGPQWRAELNEVHAVSLSLTAEQKAIALYWADGAGTVTPPGHWNKIALDLIEAADLSDHRAAKVLATLNTAQADAFIACWDAKFTYWTERPVTAIRRERDAAWTSYVATPPFPGYVSGHSTTSAAASTVLAHFFPDDGVELVAMAAEAAVSRLYGGIHVRSDNDVGLVLGRNVGGEALRGNAVARWLARSR